MKKLEYIELLKPEITKVNIEKHIKKITKYLKNNNCQDIEIKKLGIIKLVYPIKEYEKCFSISYKAEINAEVQQCEKIEKYLNTITNHKFYKIYPETIKALNIITEKI